ncbi:NAD(P)-binding protein [Nonomuraea sp. 3N208]|uniref:NAD(P)-binding protein n=1 Tax=Nonomuraea sp. 3N208 TaxID=3457421 RepID=UPI003FCCCD22
MTDQPRAVDVLVIGGGQAGLAAGYYLRRAKGDFVTLDAQDRSGGAWRHARPSLRLFSSAQYSSPPCRMMPSPPGGGYPSAPASHPQGSPGATAPHWMPTPSSSTPAFALPWAIWCRCGCAAMTGSSRPKAPKP